MEPFTAGTAAAPRTTVDQRDAPRPHVVLLASPGAGHLIPLAQLVRRLVEHHGVAATLVTFADLDNPDARSAVLSSIPASVATATLPAVPLDDLPADAPVETVIFELVHRSLPHLRELLRSMSIGSTDGKGQLTALVPDFFCSAALSVAAELGVPGYVFFPSSLSALAVMSRAVELHDGAAAGEYHALPDPLELPGGVSLRTAEFPDAFRDSTVPVYGQLVETGRLYRRAAGFLANTFYELEPAAGEMSKKEAEKGTFPLVYPVGPFVRSSSDEPGKSACLEWLDLQPAVSVVYVSFGSAGMLSVEQTRELAAGLEMSGHRFLWVVRMPSLNGESFAFGSNIAQRNGGHDDPLTWLPDGFLERTRGRGLAVAAWAPQVRVLSHPATAAFVSHCGWNSTLESVAAGVPMIAWPLHAEQRMNAIVLEESVGVALRPRGREEKDVDGGAVVTGQEVAEAVKELMEGEKGRAVRRRARDMQQAAGWVWSPEGSSRRALEEVVGKWKAAVQK